MNSQVASVPALRQRRQSSTKPTDNQRSAWICRLAIAWCIGCFGSTAAAQAPFSVLHTFTGYSSSAGPAAALVQGRDGYFYGTTSGGGTFNTGTIFRVTATGALTVLHSFDGVTDGGSPATALLEGADGTFYGTTTLGGAGDASCRLCGGGTFFSMTPAGGFTVLHRFGEQWYRSALIQGTDGSLYGTSGFGGSDDSGTAFRLTTAGDFTELHRFNSSSEGSRPSWPHGLTQGSDGLFYGTLGFSSPLGCSYCGAGSAFSMTPGGTVTVLHVFTNGSDGGHPSGNVGLIRAADGNFYGITTSGGAFGYGLVFRMTPGGAISTVHAVTGSADAAVAMRSLIQAADGAFYGTTTGGSGGTIFRMTTDGSVTLLHAFVQGPDGNLPVGLVQATDGRLYGATELGGISDVGTLFVMDVTGVVTTLYRFPGSQEGADSRAPLIQASDGNLYGTTVHGGLYNHGTLFRITPSGAFTVLYTFAGGLDGGYPRGALMEGLDGKLYGTTSLNGAYNGGTVFRVTLDGQLSTLHSFAGGSDGLYPQAGLIQARDGNFYGTTLEGGSGGCNSGCGIVFRLTPEGQMTVLHAFVGGDADYPQGPYAPLLEASDGNLYGSTAGRNEALCCGGTIFRLTPSGTLTILHSFSVSESVPSPSALVQAPDGNLYGATVCGRDGGAFYRTSLDGALSVLALTGTYCSGSGAPPPYVAPVVAAVSLGQDGRLFGTVFVRFQLFYPPFTRSFKQTVFAMTPAGAITPLHEFTGDTNQIPQAVVQASDGYLYGVTSAGGTFGKGLIFRITPAPTAPTQVAVSTQQSGAVRLTWPIVPTATSYTIRRREVSGAETLQAAGVTSTSFDDTTTTKRHRYYYTVTAVNEVGEKVSYEVAITAGRWTPGDFDGDGKADLAVYRPSTGGWWVLRSSAAYLTLGWGLSSDAPAVGDYDGDGRADIAIYRPSTGYWWILWSSTNYSTYNAYGWGTGGDIPVPADYDGDGLTDIAVHRPTTGEWWILKSSAGFTTYSVHTWGAVGDVPVVGDFDGDGISDPAIFRPSTGNWWILNSSTNFATYSRYGWGADGDVPVAADYDGDGKTDVAVYRPSTGGWWILKSSSNFTAYSTFGWGLTDDTPVPADYDGDGRTDIAIYRPTTGGWWILKSSTSFSTYSTYGWGLAEDIPMPKQP